MNNNPYEILGVDKDATPDEINAAYKAHAKKHHPDAGGSTEEFTRIKQASLVLLDPKKRKRFDDGGGLDNGKPDNKISIAMERVASFFINSINATLEHPINLDQLDLVQGANAFFDQQIVGCKDHIQNVERQIKQFNKALKRLKSKKENDLIRGMLNSHTAGLRANIDDNEKEIQIYHEAKKILQDYEFEKSPDEFFNNNLVRRVTLWPHT